MDSSTIREVLGAYQEICTKAKSILKKMIDDGIDTVFGAGSWNTAEFSVWQFLIGELVRA